MSNKLVRIVLQRNRRVNQLNYSTITRLSLVTTIKLSDRLNWCITASLQQREHAPSSNHCIGLDHGRTRRLTALCKISWQEA